MYGFFVLYKLFGWENLDTDLSRNEWDIDIWVYWNKLLLNGFFDCVIQILWGVGFPKLFLFIENQNPFGKSLFEKYFGKNRELTLKVLLNRIFET